MHVFHLLVSLTPFMRKHTYVSPAMLASQPESHSGTHVRTENALIFYSIAGLSANPGAAHKKYTYIRHLQYSPATPKAMHVRTGNVMHLYFIQSTRQSTTATRRRT
jgi:hypothetical protein